MRVASACARSTSTSFLWRACSHQRRVAATEWSEWSRACGSCTELVLLKSRTAACAGNSLRGRKGQLAARRCSRLRSVWRARRSWSGVSHGALRVMFACGWPCGKQDNRQARPGPAQRLRILRPVGRVWAPGGPKLGCGRPERHVAEDGAGGQRGDWVRARAAWKEEEAQEGAAPATRERRQPAARMGRGGRDRMAC